jgi:hypothetical protein
VRCAKAPHLDLRRNWHKPDKSDSFEQTTPEEGTHAPSPQDRSPPLTEPKSSRRERRFWAETERRLHPPEAAADPIHDLSALDAEAERAALAEVDGAGVPRRRGRTGERRFAAPSNGRKRRFRLAEAPDRAQTPASERA